MTTALFIFLENVLNGVLQIERILKYLSYSENFEIKTTSSN